MNSQSWLHFDLLWKFHFFAIVIHSSVLSLCHSYFYVYSFKISLLLLLSLITAFGQNKYGYWNGWYYSRLQCSKCFRSYLTVTWESWEKIVYFNFETKLLFTCINWFFVSSFCIAKNAEWTWTEFYWWTFHSETRVSFEDSRLLLLQMEPVCCSQTQCTCMLPAHVALPLWLPASDYLWMNLVDIEDTKTLLVMQWKYFCVKKIFFWILTLIYLDILGYLVNTCNLLLIATFVMQQY